jgi:hypothetical protein
VGYFSLSDFDGIVATFRDNSGRKNPCNHKDFIILTSTSGHNAQ